ncbi:DNA-binding transcriptional ArsR family regulator [Phyllobacterium ifriqiyense]|uniref:DNA-binding transcriptional ArsR family regulator n=1 Tax=Phyllobacterium ifriqiyense TaxID=314238 RepID=A0ABU0SAT9_9HYPH|nr:helix-turn-helix transcriptional regulator [Phyllobacterium ifriqiyense]MDQ0997880.1 DNA-binding transcriptional ArsR family regulator [Phyllobacterium ifriqiyense]
MTNALYHPAPEEIALPAVLAALGDETRLTIISMLARFGEDERNMTCSYFLSLGSKTALSYHIGKLREAGIIYVRPEGTKRLLSLRRTDLEKRFPGFLDSILASAAQLSPGAVPSSTEFPKQSGLPS